MLVSMDVTDEYSRKKLDDLLVRWITSVNLFGLEKSCVDIINLLHDKPKVRIDKMVHLVNEMLENAYDHKKNDSVTKMEESPKKEKTLSADSECSVMRARESLSQLSFVVMELKAHNPNKDEPRQLTNGEIRNLRIKVAELDVRLTELDDELRAAVDARDFVKAAPIQETINEARREREKLQLCVKTGFDRPLLEDDDLTLIEESNTQALENLSHQISQMQMSQSQTAMKTAHEMEQDAAYEGAKLEILDELEAFERLKHIPAQVVERGNMLLFNLLNSFTEPFSVPSSLRMMLTSLVLPSIRLNAPTLRQYAIRILGIISVMDLQFGKSFLCYMFTALRDVPSNAEAAIAAVSDLLLVNGLELFTKESIYKLTGNPSDAEESDQVEKPEEKASDVATCRIEFPVKGPASEQEIQLMQRRGNNLLQPIIKMLDSSDNKCRTRAGVCLSKLLFCDVIKSTELFSKLLISWFNPELNELLELRSFITKFISEFALAGVKQQWVITDSVPIVLKTLVTAIPSSPLTKISMNNVISLLVKLTDSSLLVRKPEEKRLYDFLGDQKDLNKKVDVAERDIFKESQEDAVIEEEGQEQRPPDQSENVCHDALAMRACREIVDSPNSGLSPHYIQLLSQLRVSRRKVEEAKKLYLLALTIEKQLDRGNKFIFSRFLKSLVDILKENNLTAEQVKEEMQGKNVSMTEEVDIEEDEINGEDDAKMSDQSPDHSNSSFGSEVMGMNLHLANSPEAIGRKSIAFSRLQNNVTLLGNQTFLRPAAHTTLHNETQLSTNSDDNSFKLEELILKPVEGKLDTSSEEEQQPVVSRRQSRRLLSPKPKDSEPKRQKATRANESLLSTTIRKSARRSLAQNSSLSSVDESETSLRRSARKISRKK
ncbi:hypothetical protein Ciccas_011117 [Cichlidogyrus casuarinus]|uniref:Nuclear condensin complex subunit 3 C-terminal domain-containing protein n=1 Tax=Cichlidogyrus casuarinus TaxID=1844966 RepID=A0ABD2PS67_9PLAT